MRKRLPSTMSLKVFEAAARHMSFTRAAVEVNLTQTAVSHQIRNLEEFIGTRVFQRHGSLLRLTAAGEQYLRTVRPALLGLYEATDLISLANDERVLTVQCLGTFAIKRLLPRLRDFQARHPAIQLRLKTIQQIDNRLAHDFDIAIWHGAGDWTGLHAQPLGSEEIFPVCSPALVPPEARPLDFERLSDHTVIRNSAGAAGDEWAFWLQAANAPCSEFPSEIDCDFMIAALQAAIEGLGIAMGRSTVVERDLAEGRLIAPFPLRVQSNYGYYVVTPRGAADRLKVRAFRDWLLETVGVGKG